MSDLLTHLNQEIFHAKTPHPSCSEVDAVNHPLHYTSHPARCSCGSGIECIQVTEHMGFCLGNSVKYIWRADEKGKAVEDLKKARWYIDREIERRNNSQNASSQTRPPETKQ